MKTYKWKAEQVNATKIIIKSIENTPLLHVKLVKIAKTCL